MLIPLAQISIDIAAIIRDVGVPGALVLGFGYALIRVSSAQSEAKRLAAEMTTQQQKTEDETRSKMDKIAQDSIDERRLSEQRYLNERNMSDQRYDKLREEFHATREDLVRTNTNLDNANIIASNFRNQVDRTEKLWLRETDTLKNDIKWLKGQIGELQAQLADKEKERRELAELLAAAQLSEQSAIATMQQNDEKHEAERASWKSELEQRDKQIDDLRNQVNQLTQRMSLLEKHETQELPQIELVPIG